MTPRDLAEKAQERVFTSVMRLPLRAHRVLAGRPLERDGQTLAPDVQLMLRLKQVVREPGAEDLPIPEGRAVLRRQQAMVGGRQPIGSVRDLRVGDLSGRVFTPSSASTEPGPLLLFIHGGGWIYGDLESHDAGCRFLAERSGVRILLVTYRLAPEEPFPAAYDDAIAALRWVHEHAAEVGADPARIGIGGDSAGGTLAASTAIWAAQEGIPLAWQFLLYPGTDMRGDTESRRMFNEGLVLTQKFMDMAKDSYIGGQGLEEDPRVSPLLAPLPDGLAPAYVVTAGFDPLRDEGEAYARKLADAGVPVELTRFPDQIHGFFHMVGVGHTARAAMREIASRVAAALG